MTALPLAPYTVDSSRTVAEMQQIFTDVLSFMTQGFGNAVETTLSIASGVITPTSAGHAVQTELSATADDLTNVVTANLEDGRVLLLRAVDAAHVVTLKHAAGGAGQLSLKGAVDFILDAVDKWVLLKRRGTDWVEVWRSWGADTAGERTWLGLGGAAILNVGTTAGTVSAGNHTHSGVYEPADSNLVKANASKTLTKGYPQNSYAIGATGSATITPDVANSNKQTATIDGDPTFAAPAVDCEIKITCLNSGAGHGVAFSGFSTSLLPGSKTWDATDAAVNDIVISVDLGGTRKRYGIYNNA